MTSQWIGKRSVLGIQAAQIEASGGAPGVSDEGLLESALMRPENLAHYSEPDVFALAAATAFGLARNNPFLDGNKRAAAVVSATFLEKNGYQLTATQADLVATFLKLAAGDLAEDDLAAWFRANANPPDEAYLVPEQDQ